MDFSELAHLLYPYKGKGCTEADFVPYMTSQIIKKRISEYEEKQDEWCGTPFDNLEEDTLIRIYNGTRPISKKAASQILHCLEKEKFETFIADSPDEVKKIIGSRLREKGILLSDEEVPSACANIFISILNDCANRERKPRQVAPSDGEIVKHQTKDRCDSEEDVFDFFNKAILDYRIKTFVEAVDPSNVMDIDYIEKCEEFVQVIKADNWIPCKVNAINETREMIQIIYSFAEVLDDYTTYLGCHMRPVDQVSAPTAMVPLYRDENVPWEVDFGKKVTEYREKLVSIYLDICAKMFPGQDLESAE